MNKETGGMTMELYREIVAVIDERVREIKVTKEEVQDAIQIGDR